MLVAIASGASCREAARRFGVSATSAIRWYALYRMGERLRMSAPHGRGKATTFVAGLSCAGILAPFVRDGLINRLVFEIYVERVLVADLKPGSIVITDNLSSHRGPAVKALIEAAV